MLKCSSSNISGAILGTAHGTFSSSVVQGIADITQAYPVTYNASSASNLNVSITDDPADGHSRLTFAVPGFYQISFTGQAQNANANVQDINLWIRYNGTNAPGTDTRYTVNSKHGTVNGNLCIRSIYVVKVLAAGDYIQYIISGSSTDLSLSPNAAGTSPVSPTGNSVTLAAYIIAPL